MTAKQYLNQIRVLDIKINHRIQQAEDVRKKAFLISAVDTTKDRVQSSHGDDALKYIDRYVDLSADIDRLIDEYVDLKHRIIGEIHSLSDPRYVEVLYLRYVDGLHFDEIAAQMGYARRYTLKLHRDALDAFAKMTLNVT